jgi:WbqC-like protein family
MRIAIMQPGYLPWLGFFELMQNCDLFVVLDDVQYTKRDWRSRNRIRTKEGWMWLTVPVLVKNRRGQHIRDTKINNDCPWKEKHLKSLKSNYSKARYFNGCIGELEGIYRKDWAFLLDLDMEIILFMAHHFAIKTNIALASSLGIHGLGGNDHILEICRKLGANELYDSAGAKPFIDLNLFENANIKVVFQEYRHPIYAQIHQPFLPHMSAIDLLFNAGANGKALILKGGEARLP